MLVTLRKHGDTAGLISPQRKALSENAAFLPQRLYPGNTMNKQASQPRAIYYVVALQIWEYFSFYGMRALLILYLTNQLKYDDNHAYELFSAYCSLVYVTPILGGYLADKVLGNRIAVMLGAFLMAIGHLVLGPVRSRRHSFICRWRSLSAATACLNRILAACWANCTSRKIRAATAGSRCFTQRAILVRSWRLSPAAMCKRSTVGRWALRSPPLVCWRG